MIPAIYHFNVKMVTRSKGGCCVASAAYIAGEKIKNERDGQIHDYRNKHEVVHKEILLPANSPPDFRERSKLWNAAEAAEKRKNSQTARSINAALPIELSRVEQIDLVRQFCEQCFVSKGMCCDFAIHDKGDGNPHVHIAVDMNFSDKSYHVVLFEPTRNRVTITIPCYAVKKIGFGRLQAIVNLQSLFSPKVCISGSVVSRPATKNLFSIILLISWSVFLFLL